jgi:hypothetical protein
LILGAIETDYAEFCSSTDTESAKDIPGSCTSLASSASCGELNVSARRVGQLTSVDSPSTGDTVSVDTINSSGISM